MRRGKHRIKQEKADDRNARGGDVGKAGGSGTAVGPVEERELAYYIHDRVELMHQVFSILCSRELRAMTPDCVKNLTRDDLQELCLEELLGISSKRLCAVLDGADPPSDTSSSESERLETVSLDSISSVDELSERDEPQKRKRKCKRKEAKAKNAAVKPAGQPDKSASRAANKSANRAADKSANRNAGASADKSGGADGKGAVGGDSHAAERAGMTVLELLELQARARAIRAQLAIEHTRKAAVTAAAPAVSESPDASEESDGSVEIKEEPAEVVELVSSDEEDSKPARGTLPALPAEISPSAPQSTITKRNDLTIIVPNAQKHRKVKLNRNKSVTATTTEVESPTAKISDHKGTAGQAVENTVEIVDETAEKIKDKEITDKANAVKEAEKAKAIKKKKLRKKKKSNSEGRDGSDHDEITLQLSDSEKMDLLEDFDRKNYDNVSSSDSEESSSDSAQSSNESGKQDGVINAKENENKSVEVINDKESQKKDGLINEKESQNKGEVSNYKESEKKDDVSEAENDGIKASGNNAGVEKQNEEIDSNLKKTIIITNDADADGTNAIEENGNNETSILSEVAVSENNLGKKTDDIVSNQIILDEDANLEQEKINEDDGDKLAFKESENKDQLEKNANKSSKVAEESKRESQIMISTINDIPLREEILEVENANKNLDKNKETEVLQAEQSNADGNTDEIIEKQSTDKSTEDITEKNEEEHRDHTANTERSGNVENKEKSVETENKKTLKPKTDMDTEMSDGEVSDRTSSEIEIFEKPSEVVCISDDDEAPKKKEKKKKKDKSKKKEKKVKKDKKDKKSDFREGADQNFYEKNSTKDGPIIIESSETAPLKRLSIDSHNSNSTIDKGVNSPDYSSIKVDSDSEDIYEICEISDDSSCYEVEGVSVLSKEPTSEEIEALSAKIDTEIEREDVITDEQIQQHDNQDKICANTESDNLEDVSWKDRWLGSTKVKKVLKTSNILNAMRKKNKELKKKLAESKCNEEKSKKAIIEEPIASVEQERSIEEGSITHFNTLQGSTQFVDPVKEPKAHDELIAAIKEAVGQTPNGNKEKTEEMLTEEKEKEDKSKVEDDVMNQQGEGTKPDLHKEMKKDAKQLLKMYKRLLKYNNMNKETDPNKVKKKKAKKQKKNKEKTTAASVIA